MFKLVRNKYLWVFLLILSAAVGLLIYGSSDTTGAKSIGPFHSIYAPLHRVSSGLKDGVGSFTGIFSNKKTLYAQIDQLQQQVGALQMENQSLKEYKGEAERLQKLLEFKNANADTLQLRAARVIARSPNDWYKYLWIDKGSAAGITRGMPVISPEGLVGRVDYVGKDSAQVTLITDREMAVGAILQKNRETNGIIEGLGDNISLRMKNIPFYSKLEVYDVVVTSDLSAIYPKGIPIGTVTEINKEPGGLLFNASLKPVVDFDRLEEVLVIISYKPQPTAKQ